MYQAQSSKTNLLQFTSYKLGSLNHRANAYSCFLFGVTLLLYVNFNLPNSKMSNRKDMKGHIADRHIVENITLLTFKLSAIF
jgi:hypothetical protein